MTRHRPMPPDEPVTCRHTDNAIALTAADRALRGALHLTIGPLGLADMKRSPWRSVRPAIRAFVAAYRACGAAPEATLIAFKQAICDAVPSLIGVRASTESDAETDALNTMIRWCIEDYYRVEVAHDMPPPRRGIAH